MSKEISNIIAQLEERFKFYDAQLPEVYRIPCNYLDKVQVFVGIPEDHSILELQPELHEIQGRLDNDPRVRTLNIDELAKAFVALKAIKIKNCRGENGIHMAENCPRFYAAYDVTKGFDVVIGIKQCYAVGEAS